MLKCYTLLRDNFWADRLGYHGLYYILRDQRKMRTSNKSAGWHRNKISISFRNASTMLNISCVLMLSQNTWFFCSRFLHLQWDTVRRVSNCWHASITWKTEKKSIIWRRNSWVSPSRKWCPWGMGEGCFRVCVPNITKFTCKTALVYDILILGISPVWKFIYLQQKKSVDVFR